MRKVLRMATEVLNETDYELIDEKEFAAIAAFVLQEMKVDPSVDLNIVFVDEETSEQLHLEWLGLEGPTDVMSFPVDEITPGYVAPQNLPEAEHPVLGDIVICPTVAEKQGSNHTPHEEMLLLTVHGILHLLGYDHEKPTEKVQMFELQRKLLFGYIANRDKISIETVAIAGLPE